MAGRRSRTKTEPESVQTEQLEEPGTPTEDEAAAAEATVVAQPEVRFGTPIRLSVRRAVPLWNGTRTAGFVLGELRLADGVQLDEIGNAFIARDVIRFGS